MNFPNKMNTRAEAIRRYGHIDFASKYWADQRKWIEMFEVPEGWFPNWRVFGNGPRVRHIALNRDLHNPLLAALKNIHDKQLGPRLKSFDGAFNIRMVRGSSNSPSAHAYALALDINAFENGLSNTKGGFYDQPELVKCFTDQGFDWGGNFSGRKDPMHFSYCWEHK